MNDRSPPPSADEPEPSTPGASGPDSTPEIALARVELDEPIEGAELGPGEEPAAFGASPVVELEPRAPGAPASTPLSVAAPTQASRWAPSAWQEPELDEVGRSARQRRALHTVTLCALAVAVVAVLVSAGPAFGRVLGPGRSVAAERGIARAARSAGWAEAPIAPPPASELSARPTEREALPGFDPLGPDRRGPIADPFGDARGAQPLSPGAGDEPRADDDGANLRLGVLREAAKIRSRPEPDSAELGELPASELVVVAARTGEWVLVAGTTERHNLVGWTERENVILQ
jgi:hypothetical protein